MINFKLVYSVPAEVTDFFNCFLNERAQTYALEKNTTCTQNGLQTVNIINRIPTGVLKVLHDIAFEYVKEVAKNFTFSNVLIDHVHLINYNSGGYQQAHDHFVHEDFSFILYLCDTDAPTVFYNNNHTIENFTGRAGDIIIFNSAIFHYGSEVHQQKKVAVGSIKIIDKKWCDRSKI